MDDKPFAVDPVSVTTMIDKGVVFTGTIESTNGKTIQINGQVIGKIISTSDVIVHEAAVVHGSINARRVRIAGTIDRIQPDEPNEVRATELLSLAKTARFSVSEASYADMEMELGAKISGNLRPTDVEQVVSTGGQVQTVPQTVVRFPAPAAASSAPQPAAAAAGALDQDAGAHLGGGAAAPALSSQG